MPIERVVLASFAPDADPINPSLISNSDNLYPTLRGFKNLPDPTQNVFPALATNSPCHGAFMGNYYDNTTRIFGVTSSTTDRGGSVGKIYEGQKSGTQFTGQWADVSPKRDSAFLDNLEVEVNYRAQLVVHGNKTICAGVKANASSNPVYLVSSGAEFLCVKKAGGADFAATSYASTDNTLWSDALPGGRYVVSTGEHVVLLNFAGGQSNMGIYLDETSWWCSNAGSYYLFQDDQVTSTNSNAGYLSDTPGPIVGAKPFGRDVIVFKQRAMHKLQWTGEQNVVFRNTVLSDRAGALSNEAAVDVGDRIVFLGYDDIYETSGGPPRSVPNGIRDFLFGSDGNLDIDYSFAVQAYFDRARNTVFWFYPVVGDSQREHDDQDPILCRGVIAWNIATDKWTHGTSGLGGREVVQVVVPEVIPSSALGLSYGQFGAMKALFDDVDGSTDLEWGTKFVDRAASGTPTITYNAEAIVGSSTYSPGAFVASDDTSSKDNVFAQGISGYTSPTYGTPTSPPEGKAKILTGLFGDGVSYSFVRRVKPRFVGNINPWTASLTVYAMNDADLQLAQPWPGATSPSQLESQRYFSEAGAGHLQVSSSELDIYDAAGVQVFSEPDSPKSTHWFPVRASGKYIQFVLSFTGEGEILGLDIDYDTTGTR
jgi:hypothetical protein